MSALTLSSSSAAEQRADAVVVGVAKGADGLVVAAGGEAVDAAYGGSLAATLETLGAVGGEGETTKVPAPAEGLAAPLVLATGLGELPDEGEEWDAETLRRAAGSAARALEGSGSAAFALPAGSAKELAAVAEGALLGAYAFTAYQDVPKAGKKGRKGSAAPKDGKDAKKGPLAEVVLLGGDPADAAHKSAAERAEVLAAEVARARDLVNMPPNDLTPAAFAELAARAAKAEGVKVEVLDEKQLQAGGYGGLIGVGIGSANPPRLVRLAYTGSKQKSSIALIGKGITYDSGGISLKPAAVNQTMKCDMGGAAAVLGAVLAAARLGLEVNVTGWLALAENMPSGSAVRPGDVLTMYSGKTVEVLNTDAEGRLVLADALTRAGEESPAAIVDVATLTGAMVLALGKRTFGVLGNDDDFRDTVHRLAGEAGEDSWPMPMPKHLRKTIDSPTADIANMGDRMGGGLVAGIFLEEFVPEGTKWAHLDIAGPAYNEGGAHGYTPKGGTGSSLPTLLRVVEEAAAGRIG